MSGGCVKIGTQWAIPTDGAGYHHQADAHSDMEHTLLFTLTSLSVGGSCPASDPREAGCPSPMALATVYLAVFVHEALLL